MNVKKPADYSALYAALDRLMAEAPPQMELYREIGRLVDGRQEKGAAVAAAEYLAPPILISPASPPGACTGCGNFIAPIKMPRK